MFAAEEGYAVPNSDEARAAYINMVNAGVYAIRSNNRTMQLLRQWMSPGNDPEEVDQV